MTDNIILDTDSYKSSHFLQYPAGTTATHLYFESRGGKYPEVVFFGLQYILNQLDGQRITVPDVVEAADFFKQHGVPFPLDGWLYIARELGGRLPMRIRAVPEGTVVPDHNVLMTIESTDPKVFWVPGWFETQLVRAWYPITVATRSNQIKRTIYDHLQKTSDDPDGQIMFKLHDFGSRGVSSRESAKIGGAAHLVNFMGSDTVIGVDMANRYYRAGMAGFSIPAAEHSTITSWGKDNEVAAYANMIKQFAKPGSLVAVVSDSYDIYNAVDNLWGRELKQQVIDSGGTVVIRPDSGYPPEVVLNVLKSLDRSYGSVVNGKGFKVLNHVRVIQGDGINEDTIEEILVWAEQGNFSADNIAFGMGGGLLQQLDRDTNNFAMKCSAIKIDDEWHDVYKEPVGSNMKKSKRGRLDLVMVGQQFVTVKYPSDGSVLVPVFENGKILKEYTLAEIRERAWHSGK